LRQDPALRWHLILHLAADVEEQQMDAEKIPVLIFFYIFLKKMYISEKKEKGGQSIIKPN